MVPTAVPMPMPIISVCRGKDRDTALSASSLDARRDTYRLSTTLYSACTSMDSIMGSAVDISSGRMGIVPIFSSWERVLAGFFCISASNGEIDE